MTKFFVFFTVINIKMKTKITYSIFILSFFLLATPTLALGRPSYGASPTNLPSPAGIRLTEAKLKSCQARQASISKRMERLLALATTMEAKFDAIAKRVQDYYTEKVLPNGKTVANYDTLVSTIQTKKDAVQSALTTAQTNSKDFSCETDNPKGLLNQFRLDMQAAKKALGEYRTSIKNLIVAVRSVASTIEKASPKASPNTNE